MTHSDSRTDSCADGGVPSPCINVCRMNPQTGLCEGCLRTIDEIASWGGASDDVKRAVWRDIQRRRDRQQQENQENQEKNA